MDTRSVGVLGCGLMGSGIAQVCAAAGYKTIVREVDDAFLQKGLARVRSFLDDGVAKGKATAQSRDTALGNLSGTTTFEALKDCDLIIEAIVENLEEKRTTWASLEGVVGSHTIFVSNTSSLCITELAAATRRPDRFGGLHFFNPVPIMKLVEVIRALTTTDETYRTVFSFAEARGKEPIPAPDRPGFIVNRLLGPYLLHAIRAYGTRLGTVADIEQQLREKVMGGGACRVVSERCPEVVFRQLAVAGEEAGYPVVPAAERTIRGALLERGIDVEHGFELRLDRLPVLQPGAEAV